MGNLGAKYNPYSLNKINDCEIPGAFRSNMRTRLIKLFNVILLLYCIANAIIISTQNKIIDDKENKFRSKWRLVFLIILGIGLFVLIPITDIGTFGVNTFLNLLPVAKDKPINKKITGFFDIICDPGIPRGNINYCSSKGGVFIFSLWFIAFGIILIIFGKEYLDILIDNEWKPFGTVAISMGVMYIMCGFIFMLLNYYCPIGSKFPTVGSIITTIFILSILFLFVGLPLSIHYKNQKIVGGISGFLVFMIVLVIILLIINKKESEVVGEIANK